VRDHDIAPADRLIAALRALSDNELIAVCQPFADIAEAIFVAGLKGHHRPLATVIRTERGNPRAIEFLESVGMWVLAELNHRDEVLEVLDGAS
jgi:hypothetical protein